MPMLIPYCLEMLNPKRLQNLATRYNQSTSEVSFKEGNVLPICFGLCGTYVVPPEFLMRMLLDCIFAG